MAKIRRQRPESVRNDPEGEDFAEATYRENGGKRRKRFVTAGEGKTVPGTAGDFGINIRGFLFRMNFRFKTFGG